MTSPAKSDFSKKREQETHFTFFSLFLHEKYVDGVAKLDSNGCHHLPTYTSTYRFVNHDQDHYQNWKS